MGQALAATGCDSVQGYLISRPVPGPEVTDWLAGWRSEREGAEPIALSGRP